MLKPPKSRKVSATERRIIEVLEKMLHDGSADVNGSNGCSLMAPAKAGHYHVATMLLERGANVNCVEPISGESPIHIAALKGDRAMVRLFLLHGADLDAPNAKGQTAREFLQFAKSQEKLGL